MSVVCRYLTDISNISCCREDQLRVGYSATSALQLGK